jgi:hypothetical protein
MFKLLIGVGLGIVLTVFYPDIIPYVKGAFLDSGARDLVVDQLKEIK